MLEEPRSISGKLLTQNYRVIIIVTALAVNHLEAGKKPRVLL